MRRFSFFSLVASAILAGSALVAPAFGQADKTGSDPMVIAKILDAGKTRTQIMRHLDHLTHRIGHRLTASPQLAEAYKWTQKRFKDFGCTNVHLEKWGEWPVGFDRGARQVGRMTSPNKLDFEFTTASWTAGTKGSVKGFAIPRPTTLAEYEAVKDQLKGAWLVSRTAPPRAPRTETPPNPAEVEQLLAAAPVAGSVFGSRNDLALTGGRYNVEWDKWPKDIRVTVRKKDIDAIFVHLDKKEPVQLEFNLDNKFVKGPIENFNVVAEIKGTELPDEVVIVSGHLDSWDGPGSQGALDNGTGTCVALEAARILGTLKVKPKRTIRFILWTGEEQGLFGSNAYVKAHKDELDKISAVFVDDGGTNYEGGLTCTAEMKPFFEEPFAAVMRAFPEFPMKIIVAPKIPLGGGSDHAPFNAAGVPGFFWTETGKSDYLFVHHTQHDRYEMAIPEYLVQSATNSAVTAYMIANAPTLLPRKKPAEIKN